MLVTFENSSFMEFDINGSFNEDLNFYYTIINRELNLIDFSYHFSMENIISTY